MRRQVLKWIMAIGALFIIYIGTELFLMYQVKPTIYSTVKRWAAHAPEIEAYGQKWAYVDTVDIGTSTLTKFTEGEGPYKDQMYYFPGRPVRPAYIFVPKAGTEYYKYQLSTFIFFYGI
ncbi:hypothetical protein [Paenibacillus dauci]|uniref:hypothetical protein n=1 Tax=Paenibacillus dauci TaxID=1567106 RepID=UPI000619E1DB|nr:hypothetical protein [Paenibacillus dauci]